MSASLERLALLGAIPSLLLGCPAAKDGETSQESDTVDCSQRTYTVPSARGEMAGVWDEDRQRLVLIGGDQGGSHTSSTTASRTPSTPSAAHFTCSGSCSATGQLGVVSVMRIRTTPSS